ncbi:MAG: Stk1 family PASTA domain-containing Ser/Thr kinase [Clostridium butyricum]|nr:Stk1 family PASTA domain-containing Ser/Thr kinase [Clostridium butyricum]
MNGTVLGGRYELLEKIGEGGMSEVFKARCNKLNRFVAVKILKREFCNNDDIVKKFKDEATAIATLSDNNIVNILDVGTQEDLNYIVMEYVKGKTLKDVIKQVGKMNYETAISIAIQIAKALDCAHRNNIIHRDVKPQNILVTEDGVMKVTDFGIAKSTSSATITKTTTIMGSAHYLSPEQAKGTFIDCRTDLYSLGIVLYEMVTGKLPFEADSAVTVALKHIQEDAVAPKTLNSRIPDSLNTLILKSIEKDPNKRYQTAKEFINDLQKIKDNPNAVIDEVVDDSSQHTIVMSAVTEQIPKTKVTQVNRYEDSYDDDDYDYDDDDEERVVSRKRNKNILKIVLAVGGVILLVALGIMAFNMVVNNKTLGNAEIEVPDIVGENVDIAKAKLEELNLVLVEAETETSDEPKGTILRINPKAGTLVKEKSEVRVVVSRGEDELKMPDLREDDLNTAQTKLKSLNLKISGTTEQYSSNVAKGQIISQDPAPDTVISEDEIITLVVSLGPEIKFVTVPSVVGRLSDEAKSTLIGLNLRVAIETVETKNAIEDGIVLSQSILGNKVEEGTTVTLKIGKYNKQNGNVVDENNQNESSNETVPEENGNPTTPENDSNNSNNNDNNNQDTNGTPEENVPEGPWDDPALNQPSE